VWSDRSQAAGPHSWTWDGTAGGALLPRGAWTARLTVVSWLGTSVLERTVLADSFAVAPYRERVGRGDTLVLRFTSVEPLDGRPRVTLRRPATDPVRVTATLRPDGSYRASLGVPSGPAGTATVRIDGRDTGDGRNVTTRSVLVVP
jgi:hypothetical protein